MRVRWTLLVITGLAALTLLLAAKPAADPHKGKGIDCSECHSCEKPTPENPCLAACPRHEEMSALSPDLGPSVVILGELEDLYVAVRFDHKAHATMAGMSGGCETCHHFTPPDSEHPECKSCHPVSILHEDIAQPGLKGAYHRQCMSCHTEWDHDTKCEICHEKKAGGRLQGTATEICEHSHYEPVELSELLIFQTDFDEGDKVPFHHRNHSKLYERDCTECHQEQSCTRCHVQGAELHPMGTPAETNLHDTCFNCHDDQKCDDCHGRDPDDLFQHSDTGWPLRTYHASLNCRACHGQRGEFQKLTPDCRICHPDGWDAATFDHAVVGVPLGDLHGDLDCGDCHTEGVGKKAVCEGCHDDSRAYSRSTGFGGL